MYESLSDIKEIKISNRSNYNLNKNKILSLHGKHLSNNMQKNNLKEKYFSKSNYFSYS